MLIFMHPGGEGQGEEVISLMMMMVLQGRNWSEAAFGLWKLLLLERQRQVSKCWLWKEGGKHTLIFSLHRLRSHLGGTCTGPGIPSGLLCLAPITVVVILRVYSSR